MWVVNQFSRGAYAQDFGIFERLGHQFLWADLAAHNHTGHRKGNRIGKFIGC